MVTFLSLLDSYIFSGVPSNIVWDLIKYAWQEATTKNWEELYLDSFSLAIEDFRPYLLCKVDGDIDLDKEAIYKIIHQDLGEDINSKGLHELTDEYFSDRLATELAKKDVLILGGHNLDKSEYSIFVQKLVERSNHIFKQSILENEVAFRYALITGNEENINIIYDLRDYLFENFSVTLSQLENIEQRLETQGDLLLKVETEINEISQTMLAIEQILELDRSEQEIIEEINADLIASKSGPIFVSGGLCDGYLLQPRPNQYFIAQEFRPGREDLRQAISKALLELNLESVEADDFYWGGPVLCKISALIQSTRFGVYQLTVSQNRNVYLELGIAIGLQKPFILLKDLDAEVSHLAQGLEYYPINSYLELRYEFGKKIYPVLAEITRYKSPKISISGNEQTVIIAHGNGWDSVDFSVMISEFLTKKNLTPILLSDPNGRISRYLDKMNISFQIIDYVGGNRLNQIFNAIQSARIGIYRIDKESDADTFIALGISIGLNRPGFLLSKSTPPSDLGGLSSLIYSSGEELKQLFLPHFSALLNRYSQ